MDVQCCPKCGSELLVVLANTAVPEIRITQTGGGVTACWSDYALRAGCLRAEAEAAAPATYRWEIWLNNAEELSPDGVEWWDSREAAIAEARKRWMAKTGVQLADTWVPAEEW